MGAPWVSATACPHRATSQEDVMVPKIGAQYFVKKIADQIMAPPAEAAAAATAGDLDGQVIRDEAGQPLGTAHRLPDVAVYVIADRAVGLDDELRRCLGDAEQRVFFH